MPLEVNVTNVEQQLRQIQQLDVPKADRLKALEDIHKKLLQIGKEVDAEGAPAAPEPVASNEAPQPVASEPAGADPVTESGS